MKTRILTTALMIIATLGVFANPLLSESEDSLYAPHLAVVSGSDGMAAVENVTNPVYLPVAVTEMNNAGLEEWVDSRESWEQNDNEVNSFIAPVAAVELEEWIGDRASWEQESSADDLSGVVYINTLEEWVSERKLWEQK